MRIAVFTSNSIRHKFVANSLADHCDDALVVVECKQSDSVGTTQQEAEGNLIAEHFRLRYETEVRFFPGNDIFKAKTLPLMAGELNSEYAYNVIKDFGPEAVFVFGSSIIREPLLSLPPPGRFINLHLGLSPYYRGSGTNFWPFVNRELDYVGSTILHIDAGVDTGDIIAHVRPSVEPGDNVHTVGCKVIKESAAKLIEIMGLLKSGRELGRVNQWDVKNGRYYRKSDFDEKVLRRYKKNLENGLIEEYLNSPKKQLQLISLFS